MPDLGNGFTVEVELPTGIAVELPVQAETSVSVLMATGPPGPPGASGAGFAHRQASPAAQWTVNHNLSNAIDPLILLDTDPTRAVWADVDYPTLDTAVITLPSPATGWAYF